MKTIDETGGNPPGTFNKHLEKYRNCPPPPKRHILSTREYIIALTKWENENNVKYGEYLQSLV